MVTVLEIFVYLLIIIIFLIKSLFGWSNQFELVYEES